MEDKDIQVEEQTTQNVQEEKKFTQSEFKEALQREVARKTKNMPTEERLKEFEKWEESQKTLEERQNEKDNRIKELEQENKLLKNTNSLNNAGIDKTFQKFVLSEVSNLEGEFEENLKNYIKENPQYLTKKETVEKKTTGFTQNTTTPVVSEEKTYLDKKYANNPYYKK